MEAISFFSDGINKRKRKLTDRSNWKSSYLLKAFVSPSFKIKFLIEIIYEIIFVVVNILRVIHI